MEANGVAKVKIDERGDIYLNNKPSSLDALGDEFARIKKVNGLVWYYRTSESQPAESSGRAVVNKIIEYRLPVKMCEMYQPCAKDFDEPDRIRVGTCRTNGLTKPGAGGMDGCV